MWWVFCMQQALILCLQQVSHLIYILKMTHYDHAHSTQEVSCNVHEYCSQIMLPCYDVVQF